MQKINLIMKTNETLKNNQKFISFLKIVLELGNQMN